MRLANLKWLGMLLGIVMIVAACGQTTPAARPTPEESQALPLESASPTVSPQPLPSPAATPRAEEQGFFPIGVYFVSGQKPIADVGCDSDFRRDPWRAEREYRAEFADLAREGFNVVMLVLAPTAYGDQAEEVIRVILREADSAGVKVVPVLEHVQNLLAETNEDWNPAALEEALEADFFPLFKESPAVFGYVIFDEPVPVDEPGPDGQHVIPSQLGLVRAYIERQDPGVWVLSSWADTQHMPKLQAGMASRVLFMPIYPFAEDTPEGDLSDAWPRGNPEDGSFNLGEDQPTYEEYLEMARNAVPGVPQWVIVQAFEPIPPLHPHYWRMPTPAELRLEVMLAVAHGAQGVFYFLYQSEEWVHGLRDAQYRPTPLLEETQRINAKLAAWGPLLLTLNRADGLDAAGDSGIVQPFTDASGGRYLMVVNPDVKREVLLTVTLPSAWQDTLQVEDVYTGEYFEVEEGRLTVPVSPGDGRLFRLP